MQQKDTKISLKLTHALNISNGSHIDFRPKPGSRNKSQRFEWSDINKKLTNQLAAELIKKTPEQKPQNFLDSFRKRSRPIRTKKTLKPVVKKSVVVKAKKNVTNKSK